MQYVVFIYLALATASCTPYNVTPQPINTVHSYSFAVMDVEGKGLDSAEVRCVLEDRKAVVRESYDLTSSHGTVVVSCTATPDPKYLPYLTSYETVCEYSVAKPGYYTQTGKLFNFGNLGGSSDIIGIDKADVILVKPSDYLVESFDSAGAAAALRSKVMAFIDIIKLQGLLVDCDMIVHSVSLDTFKTRSYLKFGFDNATTYNSLQLNKYDVGKRLFDDVVRKILNPLNDNLSDSTAFYGYDIKVIGHIKDFTEEYAVPSSIEYRFMMPQSAVRLYKDKDISGQQLLDSSVLLMDDERIELKLQ